MTDGPIAGELRSLTNRVVVLEGELHACQLARDDWRRLALEDRRDALAGYLEALDAILGVLEPFSENVIVLRHPIQAAVDEAVRIARNAKPEEGR